MADKKINLTIANIAITCNFGVNYFYKHFKEISGIDMLVSNLEGTAGVNMFDITASIYCAGYLAECSLKKQDPVLNKSDFEDYILSLDGAGAAKMLNDYTDTIKTAESGEPVAQTTEPIMESL